MFHLFNDKSILLSKMRCTDYYLLFQEKNRNNAYTALNTWSQLKAHNPVLLSKHNIDIKSIWKDLFKNIQRLSIENKLRQFSLKIRHRILVTKKSYKKTNHLELVGNLSNHSETGEHKMESLECQACSQVG